MRSYSQIHRNLGVGRDTIQPITVAKQLSFPKSSYEEHAFREANSSKGQVLTPHPLIVHGWLSQSQISFSSVRVRKGRGWLIPEGFGRFLTPQGCPRQGTLTIPSLWAAQRLDILGANPMKPWSRWPSHVGSELVFHSFKSDNKWLCIRVLVKETRSFSNFVLILHKPTNWSESYTQYKGTDVV